MKFYTTALIVLGLASLAACTTRGAYESIRQSERDECNQKLSDSERKDCLERTQDSYDEYQRKRAAAKDGR